MFCLRESDEQWEEGEMGNAKLPIDEKTGKVEFGLRKKNTMKILCKFWVVNVPS